MSGIAGNGADGVSHSRVPNAAVMTQLGKCGQLHIVLFDAPLAILRCIVEHVVSKAARIQFRKSAWRYKREKRNDQSCAWSRGDVSSGPGDRVVSSVPGCGQLAAKWQVACPGRCPRLEQGKGASMNLAAHQHRPLPARVSSSMADEARIMTTFTASRRIASGL